MSKPAIESKFPSRRQEASEQRRQAILDAGLDVFAEHGFAAARLDEVAERAGVAKGTIYLSFKDKEDLFEQIILGAVKPVLARVDQVAGRSDLPVDAILSGLFDVFRTQILETKRKEIIRLVLTEGGRFPRIAEFYHREVITKGLAIIRRAAQRAYERGELPSNDLGRFPHLVFAPLLLALIWQGLFANIQPLDVKGLLAAHRTILLGAGKRKRDKK